MNYYELVGWKNRSEGKVTKVSAERLNHMDNQILANANAIGNIEEIAGLGDGTLCGVAKELNSNLTDITTWKDLSSTTETKLSVLRIPSANEYLLVIQYGVFVNEFIINNHSINILAQDNGRAMFKEWCGDRSNTVITIKVDSNKNINITASYDGTTVSCYKALFYR